MGYIFQSWSDLLDKITEFRKNSKTVVFTNGCFDIVHLGHLRYLSKARDLGDCLVVGINSDDSVRRLKGEKRPINTLAERMEFLTFINSVDFVVPFDSDTPYDLIKYIVPDILVKGGDWCTKDIVGADIVLSAGGKVKSLNYEEGYASTSIIEKIVKIYC